MAPCAVGLVQKNELAKSMMGIEEVAKTYKTRERTGRGVLGLVKNWKKDVMVSGGRRGS